MVAQISQLQQQQVPVRRACNALDFPTSSYYDRRRPARVKQDSVARKPQARALTQGERHAVRTLLNSDPFVDQSPREVYATLLDTGRYHCSVSTMYRILAAHDELRERRPQRQHPPRQKPQLLAAAPNQLWSWDITKLRSPYKHVFFYLYVILDVFSRYVVGWMIAEQESAELAQQLITQSYQKQQIAHDQLTLHADRGSPMVALTTAQLLDKLGVQKTHSRPYTPNDNPFSEAHFKTLKYRPDFPAVSDSAASARQWARHFFDWYNHAHHHTALALLTPADVHYGREAEVIRQRDAVLQAAYQRHPERFVHGRPQHPRLPTAVWINPPPSEDEMLETQG